MNITVRELNKNFPYLNFFLSSYSWISFSGHWETNSGLQVISLTDSCFLWLVDKTIQSSFFNIYFFRLFSCQNNIFQFIPSESIFVNFHYLQCIEFILLKPASANYYLNSQSIFLPEFHCATYRLEYIFMYTYIHTYACLKTLYRQTYTCMLEHILLCKDIHTCICLNTYSCT